MLTYLLHRRVYRSEANRPLQFPNSLVVTMKLAPAEVFGTGEGYSRLMVHESKTHLLWNANTGRVTCKSDPGLPPLDVTLEGPASKFALQGDTVTYSLNCDSEDQLHGCLNGLQYVLPAYLNLRFPDPPVVEYVKCKLGDVDFRWEHEGMVHPFSPQTTELLEAHVASFFEVLPQISGTKNRRLVAAIYYFYTTSRLIVAGHSQWEFMAEAILNLCKALEVLFGREMDAVRSGLRMLGYSDEEIEGDYVPLLILRNVLDVAHPRIAIFPQDALDTLYMYLANTESRFQGLFGRLLTAVSDERGQLPSEDTLELDKTEKEKLARLIETLNRRNPKHQGEGAGARQST